MGVQQFNWRKWIPFLGKADKDKTLEELMKEAVVEEHFNPNAKERERFRWNKIPELSHHEEMKVWEAM